MMTSGERAVWEMACAVVDAAGAAGGGDEVARLAARGWPADRELTMGDLDETEVRAAIQQRAQDVVSSRVSS